MKKIFTLLAAMAVSMSAMAATFTFESADAVNQSIEGYSLSIAKGSGNNDPWFSTSGEMRLYANNTITITGSGINKVELTFSKQGQKDYASLSASTGTLTSAGISTSNTDYKTDIWNGSASSVTFTLGPTGQRIVTRIVVNGDGSEDPGTPPEPAEPDTPPTINPGFDYPEPTIIKMPTTSVQGSPYKFVGNNIEVSCTKGAITDSYFSAHAGFDLTFTAAKPIKGIVINGFVKKGFEATVNHGNASYLTPDDDQAANPVMVITDVNSPTVTISCIKQLRCYSVEFYFQANPEATVSGGVTDSGDIIELKFDSAEAVYESEYVELIEEPNYSIFLFNQESPEIPYFALDIYPENEGVLAGTYSWDDYTLGDYTYYVYGYGDEDFTWVEGGQAVITKIGNFYTINGTFVCDNNKTYKVSFEGEMPIYLDKDYYGDGEESAVEAINSDTAEDAPMYDVFGRRVRKGFRGIYIQNGKKFIGH